MNILYFNYLIALTLATALFIFGIETVYKYNIPCTIVALLLHYFWTAVFSWALCNGMYIFYKLWIASLSQRRIWVPFTIFGWILPIVPVIVTISITQGNYIQSSDDRKNCWLAEDNMVRLSFLVPLLAILVLNIIFLAISAIRIATVRKDDTAFKKIKSFVISCIILTPILGLSWTIMFLRIVTESINWGEGIHVVKFLDWIFILLNGPGGILFFVIVLHRYVQFRKSKKNAGTSGRETTQHSASTLPRQQRANKYRTNNKPYTARSKHEMSITEEAETVNVKIENSSLILPTPVHASGNLLPPQPDSRPLRPDNPFTASNHTDNTATVKHSFVIPIYSSSDIFFKDNPNLYNSCAILNDESIYKTSQDDIFSPGYFKNLDKSISSSFGKGGAMKSLKKFRSSFHRNSARTIVKSVISGPASSNANMAETSTNKVKSSYQQQMNELLAKSGIKKVFKNQFSSVENLVDSAEQLYMDSLPRQGKFISQGNLLDNQESVKISKGSYRLNPLNAKPRPSLATQLASAAPAHSDKYARHDPLVATFSSPLPNTLFDGSTSTIEKDPFGSGTSKISFPHISANPPINIQTTTFTQNTTETISPTLSPIYAVPTKIIISPAPVTQNSNATNSLQETSFIRPTEVNSLPTQTKLILPTKHKPFVHIQIAPIATLKPERPKPYIRNPNTDSNQDKHRKVSNSSNRISQQVKIFENLAVVNYNSQSLTRTKPGPIKKARSYESKRSIEIKPRARVVTVPANLERISLNSSKKETETVL